MSKSIKWLKYVLELRFLPVRFQRWLFSTGTRAVEFISGCAMIGYALVFAFSPNDIYNWPIYYKFKDISETTLILVFGGVGLLQLAAMYWQTYKGEVLSGYMLLISAFIWYLTAYAFWAAYPPAHTGMVIPPVLAFLCLLAGNNSLKFLFSENKFKREQKGE